MKLGVLGGTFDPVHLGHLMLAQEARARLGLDRVVFVPAGRPWLKAGSPVSAPAHRVAMLREALADSGGFGLSTVEVERPGPSYTVDTLLELGRAYGPGCRLFLIVGADSLREMWRWREPARLLELSTLVVAGRPGHRLTPPRRLAEACPGLKERMVVLDAPLVGISATEVRGRVARGLPIRYWVPRGVEEYIRHHRLYLREGDP